jgi:hypothetical protein
MTPCDSWKNRRFGGTYHLHYQGDKNQLLVTANAVPSSLIRFTLMMEARRSSETTVLTRATQRITSQETAFFIVTAVRISDLT